MNDYIIRFRKICAVLMADRTRTKSNIYTEMGMTYGGMTKLLEEPLDENFHLHASTLGKIQDFIKKYAYYETMKPEDVPPVFPEDRVNNRFLMKSPGKTPSVLDPQADFWLLIKSASERLPTGVELTITVTK